MKKFFHILAVFSFVTALMSCKNRNEELDNISEIVAVNIDSISVPQDTVAVGTAITIRTYSTMLTDCESFYRYTYASDGFTRSITANKLKINTNCGASKVVTSDFSFAPATAGTYKLSFRKNTATDSWISHKIIVR